MADPATLPNVPSTAGDAANAAVDADRAAEIELKLDVPPRWAAKVLEHRSLRTRPAGRLSRSHLVGVYYDTPTFELWQARISVRLRRSSSGWVQTVKWAGGALGGLHQRNELEWPAAEQVLSFDGIAARPGLEPLFDERLQRRLKPLFVTEFERSTRMLALPDGSKVEASLDRGRIVCGTSTHPICELELELKGGSAFALFDIGEALLADMPLRPAHRSKAERGYALAGLEFAPVKAHHATLTGGTDVSGTVAVFIGSGLEQMQANEQGVLGADDIEYLHQMRVGVRRLRSCLGAFGPALPREGLAALQTELKWLGARLGPARDWDVFCEEALPVVRHGLEGILDAQMLDGLEQSANALRARAGRSARMAWQSRRTGVLLLALGRVAAGGGFPADAKPAKQLLKAYGPHLLQRRLEKVLLRRKKAHKSASVAHLHALRIAVKKLRYAADFLGGLYADNDDARRYRNLLAKLQDCLGRICDADVMVARVREAVPGNAELIDCVRGWSACVIHMERARLRAHWRAFRRAERFW